MVRRQAVACILPIDVENCVCVGGLAFRQLTEPKTMAQKEYLNTDSRGKHEFQKTHSAS
jgi:hypothetical protein